MLSKWSNSWGGAALNTKYRPYLLRAAFAAALVALGAGVRIWPLDALGDRLTYVTYYPVVMGAALYGGAFGGVIATFLVTLLVFFWIPDGHDLMRDNVDVIGLGTFLVNGTMICVVGEIMQRTRRRMAEALALARRFGTALDQIPTYIYMKDKDRRYVYANRPTLELFGRTEKTLKGAQDADFFPPESVSWLKAIDSRVLDMAENTAEEVVTVSPSGERRVYWEVKTPIYDSEDPTQIWGLCGISTDITEREQREARIEESEARFRATFDEAAIGMALVSKDGGFVRANMALCGLLGYSEAELRQMTFQQLTHPEDLEKDLTLLAEVVAGTRHNYQMEKRYFRKGGELIWALLSVATVREPGGEVRYFISQIQDISERKRMLDKLRDQANLDYLTGLHNRRYFIERGTQELARAARYDKPLSLLMLDIDEFKQVNDTRGHRTGDLVLRHLSRMLGDTLRNVDVSGRLGGEEFAILLPETDAKAAAEIAERLRVAIADASVVPEDGPPIRYTVSIGVTTQEHKDVNVDTLLGLADKALYQAKRSGRNRVCVCQKAV
jgi:diguanylate cyclase (GGDEF)-like protein/PAS domain S-box-containing protein